MPPFNPFLRAFFKSALPAQCHPVSEYVLLVPTTTILFNTKDTESGLPYHEACLAEDFLASHLLHARSFPTADGRDSTTGNVRETKAKPKQYSTHNSKTVIVKDNYVYSNKGFRTLNQAQLLQDALYFPDSADGQQWLVYYISKPLVGTLQHTPIVPAIISNEPSQERKRLLAEATRESSSPITPTEVRKKEIKSFQDILTHYPIISRQVSNGLEDVLRTFISKHDKPVAKQHSRRSSVSSHRSTPSTAGSFTSIKSSLSGSTVIHPTSLELEPDEEQLRSDLETAISSATALFQSVDRTQLQLLGSSTHLDGLAIERMLERHIVEQVHDQTVFPRICAIRKQEDTDLENKLRRACDIDIAQVGIAIDDGMKGKRALAIRLKEGVKEFQRLGASSSAQEMLEVLLETQRVLTVSNPAVGGNDDGEEAPLAGFTVNADVLVSMLLIVVIRSGVRHLHSRLLYMRYFVFVDEVDSGENGYALATLEAVLTHLSSDSRTLRRASKKNRALWQASMTGDVQEMKRSFGIGGILANSIAEDSESPEEDVKDALEKKLPSVSAYQTSGGTNDSFAAVEGSLDHVFPFQRPPTPPPELPTAPLQKEKKRVSMAPRATSQASLPNSQSHSRTMSVDSCAGPTGDDLTAEKLAQTQDADGNSVLMMAVEADQVSSVKFLLSLPTLYPVNLILDDMNDNHTTLLSAAVQSGNQLMSEIVLSYLDRHITAAELASYLSKSDTDGRCVAHYLFNQPQLLPRLGKSVPWTLKDKNGQTPLFALCRSYDHEQYKSMVEMALRLAVEHQRDGQPLHLDDHVDAKGNTLLHIVNEPRIIAKLLKHGDCDINAANDRRFTPIMASSKYGRIDLVRVLFSDPRADISLRDLRGLSALELAKDDDVRNQIDDLVLLNTPTEDNKRMTSIVRSFFVEDATVRMILKSGAWNPTGTVTINTCRRSLADFEYLAGLLSIECPASWLPSNFNLPSPFVIPSRPSRAVLRDVQLRLNEFFGTLLTHTTFSTHELVWEFFLVPELDATMLSERTQRKAELRVENLREDYDPVTDVREAEHFVVFAKEQVHKISQATRKVVRSINQQRMRLNDLFEASTLSAAAVSTLHSLPLSHTTAYERYTKSLTPTDDIPLSALYYTFRCNLTCALALQNALERPAAVIGSMAASERAISRSQHSLSRSNRWTPNISLFEDAKRAVAAEAWQKEAKARRELETLGSELRYTMVTVASELAGWQDQRTARGKRVLREFAIKMVVKERERLDNMMRALREIKKANPA